MSRKEKILKNIDVQSMKGIEIGALDRPIVNSSEATILFADHASTEDLRKNTKMTTMLTFWKLLMSILYWVIKI